MHWKEKSIDVFIDALASGMPTPGGGGASALVGAQAASLVEMVASLTLQNKKYTETYECMIIVKKETQEIRRALLDSIDRDADVFNALMAIWKSPKDTLDRAIRLEQATYKAAQVPLEIADLSSQVIPLAEKVLNEGVVSAKSDGQLALIFAAASIRGALHNVYINLQSLPKSNQKETIAEKTKWLEAEAKRTEVILEVFA